MLGCPSKVSTSIDSSRIERMIDPATQVVLTPPLQLLRSRIERMYRPLARAVLTGHACGKRFCTSP